MSSVVYGLTPAGFVPKQQQQIITEMNTSLQATFGQNVNLGAETIFGQLVGIISEREALLWQLAEAVYNSQYPGGAEGVAVDNILALNNLTRLPASATVTNPTPTVQSNGVTLYGLVLYGTPGTVIPQGSLIKSATTPQVTFTLDAQQTIAAAVNAQQLVVVSNTPTSGSYTLSVVDSAGNTLVTPAIPYNALPTSSQLSWATTPTSGSFSLMLGNSAVSGTSSYLQTASSLQALIRAVGSLYAGVTVTGSLSGGFTINWGSITNPQLALDASYVAFASAPLSGTYSLTLGAQTTAPLNYNATAAQVQAAINALPGYGCVLVGTYAGSSGSGFALNWGNAVPPTVSFATNTTGKTTAVGVLYNVNTPVTTTDSIQAAINTLQDPTSLALPFSDVALSGNALAYTANFGGVTPASGQPSSGSAPQQTLIVASNTLQQTGAVTNVATSQIAAGAPAQAVGTATCNQTGPNYVLAGQLTQIGSPLSGWTGVTNQLDCLPGSNVETDTNALVRRSTLLAAQANGPLQSIVEKVEQLPGVTSAVGFQNTTLTAIQTLTFSSMPTSGSFSLQFASGITAAIPYSATAAQVQSAINAVVGYSTVLVSGSTAFGFYIDFNGSQGGQAQPPIIIASNTLGVTITQGYGRPPKSFEIVVQGGSNTAIAQTIYQTMPAGIVSYGTPAAITQGSVTSGSNAVTVAAATGIAAGQSVFGLGIPNGATVASVNGTTVNLSLTAIGTYAAAALTFSNGAQISDAFGNPIIITFSRPLPVLFYVQVTLLTDTYRSPGVPSSGANTSSKFNSGSIPTIQQNIVNIGNAVPVGGTVVGYGSGGLIGAFNSIPGIVGYQLSFGTAPNPSSNANIPLLSTQIPLFEAFNVSVAYS